MAKKKHESDTIKQQRLARKEFLELKKIERGEIEPETKPEDNDNQPAGKKVENFWFYYGKIVIIAVIITIGIIFSTVQCINKPKYDLKVIYFTYEQIPDSITEKLADNLQKYCADTNKDSKINITVINCSVNKDEGQLERYQKLQALIYADEEAVLFVTDEESKKYFDTVRTDNADFFKEKTTPLPDDFFAGTDYKPKNQLTLSVRNLKGTDLNKKGAKFVKTAETIIDKIKQK